MAEMEFRSRISRMIGEATTTVATEGGSVIAGLLGAGVLGKIVEKNLGTVGSKAAVQTSTMMDKGIAWVANNGPKVVLWYLLKKEGMRLGGLEKDIEKGIVASVVLDTVIRATNKGAPKSVLSIAGYDVLGESSPSNSNPQLQAAAQQLIQENSTLRSQLNQAMGKLASQKIEMTPLDVNTTGVTGSREGNARRTEFGAMEAPAIEERHRRFGQMFNDSRSGSIGTMFGMD